MKKVALFFYCINSIFFIHGMEQNKQINQSHYELPSIEIYGEETSEMLHYIFAKSKKDLYRAQLFEEHEKEEIKKSLSKKRDV